MSRLAHRPTCFRVSCSAFVTALAMSLALHLVILFPPGLDWRIPRPLPEPMRLNITLNRVAAPPAPPRKPPPPGRAPVSPPVAPAPARTPSPLPDPAPAASVAPDPAPGGPAPENTPVDMESPPPEPSELPEEQAPAEEGDIAFPPKGEIRYTVYRGTQGFEIGRATHQWEFAEGRYQITSAMETTGLASWFRPLRVESQSQGKVGPFGLQPERYRMSNRKSREEQVDFDWENWQLRIGDQPPETLQPGSQDLLSLQYQFAYMVFPSSIAVGPRNSLYSWVATSKKYERIPFEIVGPETLELPAGSFATIHLQSIGSSQTDLWLSPDYLMLPVKIRFTDKDGDTYEQAIREMIVTPPETPPLPNLPEPPP
jgi:hypothetical protein